MSNFRLCQKIELRCIVSSERVLSSLHRLVYGIIPVFLVLIWYCAINSAYICYVVRPIHHVEMIFYGVDFSSANNFYLIGYMAHFIRRV